LYKEYLFEVYSFGNIIEGLGYDITHVGNIEKDFYKFLKGKHILCQKMYKNKEKKKVIFVGSYVQRLENFEIIKQYLNKIRERLDNVIINYIQLSTEEISAYELGLSKDKITASESFFEQDKKDRKKTAFYSLDKNSDLASLKKDHVIIYQGSHID
jgi:deoxyhypusine synthase